MIKFNFFSRYIFSFTSIFIMSSLFIFSSAQTNTNSSLNNNSQAAKLTTNPPEQNEKLAKQEEIDNLQNPYAEFNANSLNPIPMPNILYKKRIWREIYLKERKNRPFFSRNREITKFIIEGVKAGALIPYVDENLDKPMTKEQFMENLALPQDAGGSSGNQIDFDDDAAAWNNKKNDKGSKGNTKNTDQKSAVAQKHVEYFLPNEITTLEIMEDLIFEKVKGKFIYDIQTIKLIIPADRFPTGLRKNLATFRYKDLVNYLNSRPKETIWFNEVNSAGHITMVNAIEQRRFDSRIVKLENTDDLTLEDIYNKYPKHNLYASLAMEEKLIELCEFFWEK
jgi:gliding motility associated protien GldN